MGIPIGKEPNKETETPPTETELVPPPSGAAQEEELDASQDRKTQL